MIFMVARGLKVQSKIHYRHRPRTSLVMTISKWLVNVTEIEKILKNKIIGPDKLLLGTTRCQVALDYKFSIANFVGVTWFSGFLWASKLW